MEKHLEVRHSGAVPGQDSMTTMEEKSFVEEHFERVCPELIEEVAIAGVIRVKSVYLLGIAEDVHCGIGSYLLFFPQLLVNDGKVTGNLRDDHATGGDAHQQRKGVMGDEQAKDLQIRFHSRRNQMPSFPRQVLASARKEEGRYRYVGHPGLHVRLEWAMFAICHVHPVGFDEPQGLTTLRHS